MGFFQKAAKGVGWMGGLRFLSRGLTLLRTSILARLLIPAQFGVFGVVTLAITLFEILTETGINTVLIQEDEDIKPLINAAWGISIFRGILISLLVCLSAYPLARFFSTPEAAGFLFFASLVPLVRGLINPSIIKFQKELEFRKEFGLRLSVLLIESLVAIISAYWRRSVTSLILALLAGASLEVFLSFIFCQPRPRLVWEKEKVNRIISRGKWITLTGIFSFLVNQGDDAVVGRLLGMNSLGLYQMAYKISNLPFTEVTDVFSRVAFPVYAKISRDKARVKRAFLKTLLATALFIIPGVMIIFFFPEAIIKIVLGEAWLEASQVLRILAFFGLMRAFSGAAGPILLAFKRQDLVARINLFKLVLLFIFILPLTLKYGLVGAGWAVLLTSFLVQPLIWQSVYEVLK